MSSKWWTAAMIMLLAGCSSSSPGVQVPPRPTSPPPSALSVPSVAAPTEMGRWAVDPCGAIDVGILNGTSFEIASAGVSVEPRICAWKSETLAYQLELTMYPDQDILRAEYSTATSDIRRYLPRENEYGFPTLSTYPDPLTCTITVGISDRQGFQLRSVRQKPAESQANCAIVEVLQLFVSETIRKK